MKPGKNRDGYHYVSLYKNGKEKKHYIHRLVGLAFIRNTDGKEMVDHVDRDRTNNHVQNLRWATASQQQTNRGKPENNTSGYKGVSYHKPTKKYAARIGIDGKLKFLGLFTTAKDASTAYEKGPGSASVTYCALEFDSWH